MDPITAYRMDTYRNELAARVADHAEDRDAIEARVMRDAVYLDSLQSEWTTQGYERAVIADLASRSHREHNALSAESRNVLTEVARHMEKAAGASVSDFHIGDAVCLAGTEILSMTAVRAEPDPRNCQGFVIHLHETPGMAGGLLYVEPMSGTAAVAAAKHAQGKTLGELLQGQRAVA